MGYFPNGTAGDVYQEMYCSKCHHDINEDCPVFLAHLVYNYDECNKPDSILHMLIPRNAKGNNEECRLFIPRLGKIEDAA
jgi:hypothetical protein